jgi:hypothetical protein
MLEGLSSITKSTLSAPSSTRVTVCQHNIDILARLCVGSMVAERLEDRPVGAIKIRAANIDHRTELKANEVPRARSVV